MGREVETPEGARWDCRRCGFCCTFVTLGPVEPAIIDGLKDREVERDWAPAAGGWYQTRPGPDGALQTYLERIDGACVFLRDDNSCAVHALYGAEAKPGFCREFPYRVVEVEETAAVVVRGDCSGFHESFRDGQPVASRAAEIMALERVTGRGRFAPDSVEALPGHSIDTATWLVWERALIATQESTPLPPVAAVARIRVTLASQLGIALAPADPARFQLAGRAVLEGLRLVTARAVQQGGGSPKEVAFAGENLRRLEQALKGWGALEPLSEEAGAYLDLLLRSNLLGKQYQAAGGPVAGLGLFLLGVQVARICGGGALDPLAHHLSRFLRFANNRAALEVLQLARPALVDLFLNAESA